MVQPTYKNIPSLETADCFNQSDVITAPTTGGGSFLQKAINGGSMLENGDENYTDAERKLSFMT